MELSELSSADAATPPLAILAAMLKALRSQGDSHED